MMKMTFSQGKITKILHQKSKAAKQVLEHQVSLAAMAASAPDQLLPDMKLERRSIKSLKGLKKRARKSEKQQIERVARSIKRLGQAAPILIDEHGAIIDGHIVVAALKSLGVSEIWCAVIDHLDENEKALLHVALNRIAECGDWDLELLQPLLIELDDIGFDLETTGFPLPELDLIMADTPGEPTDEDEEEIFEPPTDPVTVSGDLWLLGKHRLYCGDATEAESYAIVLDGKVADAIFTDLPWNIPIEGFVSGLGKIKHKDFKQGAGEMSPAEFTDFCDQAHQLCSDNLVQGGVLFSCSDWRSLRIIVGAGCKAGLRHINIAVWNKGRGGMGTLYRSSHEFVAIFCKGDKLAVNNVALGKHGRDRSNIWSYPGANHLGSSANKALADHPTPKPIEMVRDAFLDVTKRGALVLDPFLGSGTVILAAEECGRRACGIELDPAYVDVAIRRWEAMTQQRAVHQETGLSFAELAAQRASQEDKPLAA